ncbi:hypothetical protein PYK79_47700, partial [Streptomyces sp. ID05-04B]|uniref:hypothetical protein n=1 Tax=Streptomyces sp. ID05-04B TaxID=3028661 RepID=UPI0029C5B354
LLDFIVSGPASTRERPVLLRSAGLEAEIQYAEFPRAHDRLRLSEAVRGLGAHAPTERAYVALVDLANRLRPALDWRWPALRRRTGRSRVEAGPDTLSS